MDALKILITAHLDKSKSLTDIKKIISDIEKEVGTLKLKVEFDKGTIQSFINAVEKIKAVSDQQNKTVSQTQEIFKELDGTVKSVTKTFKDNGDIFTKTKIVHDAMKKSMQDENTAAMKLAEGVEKLTSAEAKRIRVNMGKSSGINGFTVVTGDNLKTETTRLESDGQTLKGKQIEYNFEKYQKLQLKQKEQELKDAVEVDNLRVKIDNETYKIRKAIDDRAAKDKQAAIQQAIREEEARSKRFIEIKRQEYDEYLRLYNLDKTHYIANEKNKDVDRKKQAKEASEAAALAKRQNDAEIAVTNLKRRYGAGVDSAGLDNYLAKLKALSPQMTNFQQEAVRLRFEIDKIGASAKSSAGHTINFGEALRTAMIKMPVWMAATTIFFQTINFFKNGVSYVNELNKSLTQLSVVFMQGQAEVAKYGEQFHQMGMEMGILTEELAKGAVEFARQGLAPEETMKRMQTAVKYSAVSNIEFAQSAKILTATINSMGVDADRAADVFSYLGDATATGADEIGVAMQKVGGTAGAVGLEFEKVASWISVISSRTRESAETVGDGVKAILARFQSLKQNGFDSEDGTSVNEVAKALSEVGIQMVDSAGNFRDFGKIMDELGAKWSSLSQRQRSYVATVAAGTYQQSKFSNLMEGYADSVNLYNGALTSAGIANEKFNLVQEGTEAKLNKLKNAWTGIFQSSFKSDEINTVIEALTGLAEAVDTVVEKFGLLPTILGAATFAVLAFKKSVSLSLVTAMAELGLKYRALSVVTEVFTASTVGARIAVVALQATLTLGLSLAITAIVAGLMKLVENFREASAEQEAFNKQQKQISDNMRTQGTHIKELVDQYTVLDAKRSRNTEEEQKYLGLTAELARLMPSLVKNINDKGEAHLKSAAAIQEELQYAEKLAAIQNKTSVDDEKKNIADIIKNRKEAQGLLESNKRELESGMKTTFVNGKAFTMEFTDAQRAELEMKVLTSQHKIAESSIDLREKIKSLTASIVEMSGVKLDDGTSKELDVWIKDMDVMNLTADQAIVKSNDLAKAIATIKEAGTGKASSAETFVNYEKAVNLLKTTLGATDEKIKPLIDHILGVSVTTNKSAKDVGVYSEEIKKLDKNISDMDSSVSDLASAYQKLQDGQSLSVDELITLADKYPQIQNYLITHNGLIEDQGQLLQDVAEIQRKTRLAETQALLDSVQDTYNALESKRQIYEEFYSKLNPMMGVDAKKYGISTGLTDGEKLKLAGLENTKQKLELRMKLLAQPINLSTYGRNPKQEKQDTQANLHELTDFSKEEIANINNVIKARDQNIKSLEKQIQTAKKAEDQVKVLELTNKLLTEQRGKIQDIETANNRLKDSADKVREENAKLAETFAKDDGAGNKIGFDSWFNDDATASQSYIEAIRNIDQQMQALEGDGKNLTTQQTNQIKQLENQKELYQKIFGQIQNIKQAYGDNTALIEEMNNSIEATLENINQISRDQLEEVSKQHDAYLKDLKDAIGEIADSYSEAYDALKDAENKRHDNVTKNLDAETKAFEKATNDRIQQLERENDTQDYDSDLSEKQKARQKIVDKINALALNDSVEAQIKKKALQEDLEKADADIEKMKRQRSLDLQKQDLQDSLDLFKEGQDKRQNAEDKMHQQELDRLEELKKAKELYFKDIMSSEDKMLKFVKEQATSTTNSFKNDFAGLTTDIQSKSALIGASIQTNIINKLNEAMKAYNNVNSSYTNTEKDFSGSTDPTKRTKAETVGYIQSLASDYATTHQNNGAAQQDDITKIRAAIQSSSEKINYSDFNLDSSMDGEEVLKKLQEKSAGWQELKQSELIRASKVYLMKTLLGDTAGAELAHNWAEKIRQFKTGGYTGSWGEEGKLGILHEQELVLNKSDTSNILKVVDIVRGFVSNFKTLNFTPQVSPAGATYNLSVNIDSLTGDKSGANVVISEIVKGVRKLGG